MKRYIKSSTNNWWDKYYDKISLKDASAESGMSVEELKEFEQSAADSYGFQFVSYLAAKDEYRDKLDYLADLTLYKDGNNYLVGYAYGGSGYEPPRINSVNEDEVLRYLQ